MSRIRTVGPCPGPLRVQPCQPGTGERTNAARASAPPAGCSACGRNSPHSPLRHHRARPSTPTRCRSGRAHLCTRLRRVRRRIVATPRSAPHGMWRGRTEATSRARAPIAPANRMAADLVRADTRRNLVPGRASDRAGPGHAHDAHSAASAHPGPPRTSHPPPKPIAVRPAPSQLPPAAPAHRNGCKPARPSRHPGASSFSESSRAVGAHRSSRDRKTSDQSQRLTILLARRRGCWSGNLASCRAAFLPAAGHQPAQLEKQCVVLVMPCCSSDDMARGISGESSVARGGDSRRRNSTWPLDVTQGLGIQLPNRFGIVLVSPRRRFRRPRGRRRVDPQADRLRRRTGVADQ